MLKRLLVKNLAIIRDLEVSFSPGLNLITGETGAGKSILIDAIGLLVSGRAPGDLVRTGEDTAVVEGEWMAGEKTRLVRRIVRTGGASRIFLDEEPIKLADLESLTGSLVDLHGQHEHQSLLRVRTHLDFLDAYAGLLPDRQVLAHTYQHLVQVNEELRRLETQVEKDRELDELHRYQLQELEAAGLAAGEEEELAREHKILSGADELHRLLTDLEQRLQKDERSVAGELGGLLKQLDRFAQLSPELERLGERLSTLKVDLEDLAYEAGRYSATVNPDPRRLAEIDDRLGQLEAIKRKYGGTIDTALEKLAWLKEVVNSHTASGERLARLKEDRVRQREAYAVQCQALSQQRKAAGAQLEGDIRDTLARLDMPGTRLEIRIENQLSENGACLIEGQTYRGDERGFDQVEFYISPNPGEELRPLAKIASGGEISRIMLAIKTVLAAYDPVGCLIFDEIDNGISGSTAETVGIALKELARSRQVICITHLPQIAAQGDHHLLMSKEVVKGRTLTRAQVVQGEERRKEVARLLSGVELTQASLDQATELLASPSGTQEAAGNG